MPVTPPGAPSAPDNCHDTNQRRAFAARHPTPERLTLTALLLLALALRLAMAARPSLNHPDEVFQYLEAAHRLVFGYGTVPWEYVAGIRSWLFPAALAGPMALGEALDPGGTLYLWLPRLAMVAASLAIVGSAWSLGRRTSPLHALLGGFATAVWAELVYFAPHTLTETAATAAILPAVALLASDPQDDRRPHRRVAIAGALLAIAFVLRFQYAPGLIVLAAFGCRTNRRKWAALITGGVATFVLSSAIDIWSGTAPFAWLVRNIQENLIENRAAQYGSLGPFGHITWLEHIWGWWLAPIAIAVIPGARRQPALFWAAVAVFVMHSLIGHKEYRFIAFSTASFIVLAGIGTADWIERAAARFRGLPRNALPTAALAAWGLASWSALRLPGDREMVARGSDMLAAQLQLARVPGACGVALYKRNLMEWGGYTYLHRPIPVSYIETLDPALTGTEPETALARWAGDYNRVLTAPGNVGELPPGYRLAQCFTQIGQRTPSLCLYNRPGRCTAASRSPFMMQRVLERSDQQLRAMARTGTLPY